MNKPIRSVFGWVGVIDDKMDLELSPNREDDEYCRIYATRAAARQFYVATIKVEIRPAGKGKR